jgi:predicted O-methyltransferase YrrM
MSTSGRSPLSLAKQAYANTAKAVGRGMVRTGIAAETAPPVEKRWAHWRHSLTKVYDSLAMAKMDVPWWTYDAIEAVDSWLARRERPIRVFEYGSGASTIWLSRRAEEIHTVEHHRGFGEMMAAEFASLPQVSLRIIEPVPSDTPRVGSQKEGHAGLDFADYVDSIDAVEGEFDLIVVDGRVREACLVKAVERLKEDGLIVFDNSRRKRYQAAIQASGLREERLKGLTPTLPYPEQTSLLLRP